MKLFVPFLCRHLSLDCGWLPCTIWRHKKKPTSFEELRKFHLVYCASLLLSTKRSPLLPNMLRLSLNPLLVPDANAKNPCFFCWQRTGVIHVLSNMWSGNHQSPWVFWYFTTEYASTSIQITLLIVPIVRYRFFWKRWKMSTHHRRIH